ncbi:hypothetical protein ACF0H5_006022 [Mactra antiquata]
MSLNTKSDDTVVGHDLMQQDGAMDLNANCCDNARKQRNTYRNGSSRTNSLFGLKNLWGLMFIMFAASLMVQHASALPSFLCHNKVQCMNGGQMHIPDGPFGFCQCVCPKLFVGLRCEFNRLFDLPNRRVRRNNRLKRLARIRNKFAYILADRRRHRHAQR